MAGVIVIFGFQINILFHVFLLFLSFAALLCCALFRKELSGKLFVVTCFALLQGT